MKKNDISSENLSKLAFEGSAYNLVSLIVNKFGGLIFTIILARMLLPELFGIYALVFSIVTLAMAFTDLGIDNTFLRYLSASLGKNDKKLSRGYFKYITKIKSILIIISVVGLLLLSKFLSYNIYENPLLFYPIIFACLFIISESIRSFLGNMFIAIKDFKSPVFFEMGLQISKIFFSIFAILILTDPLKISGVFIAFFISSFFSLILVFFALFKKENYIFKGETKSFKKSKINNYWKYMVFASVSLAFFGSIDILMLGKFVAVEYLGYYRVSLSLILTIASLFSLSTIFIPIFTQINNKRFKRGFHKTLRYILLLSIPATLGISFVGKYLIKAVYGNEYLLGAISLYFLSLLVITTPLIGLYSMIFQSKEKPKIVSNAVLVSLIMNIFFNILVIFLFKNHPLFIIGGVGLATSLSRVLLLGLLIFHAKREFNFRVMGIGLRTPLFATFIMALFLFVFNYFVNMSLLLGVIEVLLGAAIYIGALIWIKGIKKEDWILIKSLFRRR